MRFRISLLWSALTLIALALAVPAQAQAVFLPERSRQFRQRQHPVLRRRASRRGNPARPSPGDQHQPSGVTKKKEDQASREAAEEAEEPPKQVQEAAPPATLPPPRRRAECPRRPPRLRAPPPAASAPPAGGARWAASHDPAPSRSSRLLERPPAPASRADCGRDAASRPAAARRPAARRRQAQTGPRRAAAPPVPSTGNASAGRGQTAQRRAPAQTRRTSRQVGCPVAVTVARRKGAQGVGEGRASDRRGPRRPGARAASTERRGRPAALRGSAGSAVSSCRRPRPRRNRPDPSAPMPPSVARAAAPRSLPPGAVRPPSGHVGAVPPPLRRLRPGRGPAAPRCSQKSMRSSARRNGSGSRPRRRIRKAERLQREVEGPRGDWPRPRRSEVTQSITAVPPAGSPPPPPPIAVPPSPQTPPGRHADRRAPDPAGTRSAGRTARSRRRRVACARWSSGRNERSAAPPRPHGLAPAQVRGERARGSSARDSRFRGPGRGARPRGGASCGRSRAGRGPCRAVRRGGPAPGAESPMPAGPGARPPSPSPRPAPLPHRRPRRGRLPRRRRRHLRHRHPRGTADASSRPPAPPAPTATSHSSGAAEPAAASSGSGAAAASESADLSARAAPSATEPAGSTRGRPPIPATLPPRRLRPRPARSAGAAGDLRAATAARPLVSCRAPASLPAGPAAAYAPPGRRRPRRPPRAGSIGGSPRHRRRRLRDRVGGSTSNTVTFEQLRAENLTVTQATRLLAHRERLGRVRGSVRRAGSGPGFPSRCPRRASRVVRAY